MITWTVGSGGLLGGAVRRQVAHAFEGSSVPWGDPDATATTWRADAARFQEEAGSGPWALVWAAGSATVASSTADTAPELESLVTLLDALRDRTPAGPGAFFLTSSAGGVYAGSSPPPFDAAATPVAVSAYGELKLSQEDAARRALTGVCPVVIGRVSNLYGPGQNLAKLQGLVSRLAMAAATQEPLNIFVPLDTIRDYIYVDDAAAAVLHWASSALGRPTDDASVRVVASGQAVTVGALIRTMHLVTKRRIPIALGSHPSAASQVRDLRLARSGTDAELSSLPLTSLAVGMKNVYLDVLDRLQQDAVTGSR